jgi:hypothetical protein
LPLHFKPSILDLTYKRKVMKAGTEVTAHTQQMQTMDKSDTKDWSPSTTKL